MICGFIRITNIRNLFSKELQLTLLVLITITSFLQAECDIIVFKTLNVNEVIAIADLVQQEPKMIFGIVVDQNGNPVSGVSVVVKNSTIGTITDEDGNFSLAEVREDGILLFSFIGMKTREVEVGGQNRIKVTLELNMLGLNEVVIVGYGSQKKVNLTGAVSTVKMDEIASFPAPNTAMLIQGRIPGVTVMSGGAQPGKDNPMINIRGIGTLGNSSPMLIVDGVEAESFSQISPNDIKEVTILKDAASAAIYGVRAANGVILITTKRGETGKLRTTLNSTVSFSSPTVLPDYLDSWQWAMLHNESEGQEIYTPEMIQKLKDGSDPDYFANTYWPGEIFRTGVTHKHYLSASGGGANGKYMISLEYLDQEGMMRGTSNNRVNLRSNVDLKVNEMINVGLNISGTRQSFDEPADGTGGGSTGIMRKLYWFTRPTVPVKYSNGHWGAWDGAPLKPVNIHNPLQAIEDSKRTQDQYNFNAQAFATVKLLSDFNFKTVISGRFTHNLSSLFKPRREDYDAKGVLRFMSPVNYLDENLATGYVFQNDNFLSYQKSLKAHGFVVLVGHSMQHTRLDHTRAYIEDFPNDELFELDAGANNPAVGGNASIHSIQSFFGRFNYNFGGKYLFEFNIRRDGSSRMPRGNRYGVFPSFSGGWRLSEERFFNLPFISNLKLRGSWGRLGNQEIGNYAYSQSIALRQNYIFGNQLTAGAAQTSLANSDIKWESTTVTDLGMDLSLFKGKVSITGDYFIKRSSDILLQLPINLTLGDLAAPYQNAGKVENKGWEMDFNYRKNKGEFTFSLSANLSRVNNKIVDLKGLEWTTETGIYREGYPINVYYGYISDGIYQNQEEIDNGPIRFNGNVGPGDLIYSDISGSGGRPDGKVDEKDRIIIGNGFPDLTYSFSGDFSFRNFTLSIFFQGISGLDRFFYDAPNGNLTQKWLQRWTAGKPSTTMPRLNGIQNEITSDFWMTDASYLRLKNLVFGYNLPRNIVEKVGLSNIRLYVAGNNLLTITKVKSWDPEKFSSDNTNYAYPQDRTYTLGLNIDF